MELKIEPKAIKFGMSEHKRENLLEFYFNAAKSFNKISEENLTLNEIDRINQIFLNNEVYKVKKNEIDIRREISFFRNQFPLFDEAENKKINLTNLCTSIINNDDRKIFKGKTYLENVIILFLIQQNKTENIKKNPFFYGIELAKTKSLEKDDFFKNIFEMHKSDILKLFENKNNFNQILNKYFTFGSGYPNPTKNKGIYDFQAMGNNLIELIFKNVFFQKNNEKDILEYFYKYYCMFEILEEQKIITNMQKVFKKVLKFDKKNNLNQFKIKYESGEINDYLDIIKNITINDLINDFYFNNKNGEYINLIKKYLFLTDFFIIKSDVVIINENYREYIDQLEKHYNEILKISLKNDDIIKKLEELNIDDDKKINYYTSVKNIINNYYDENFYNKFFEIILINNNININKELIKLGKENKHINGILDAPTIFEFVINVFFFKLFYKNELQYESIIDEEELTLKFQNSLNTYLTSNLIPLRFASGGRSDANFSEQRILIEPTLETNNQIKHELGSIIRHLAKEKYRYSAIVSPKISDEFLPQVKSYKDYKDGYIIIPIDAKILKNIQKSNYSEIYFENIKNSFENCHTYEEIEKMFDKFRE